MDNNVNANGNPVNNGNAAPPVNSLPPKKPVFKKWWFWVLVVVIWVVVIAGVVGTSDDKKKKDEATTTNVENNSSKITEAPEEKTEYAVGETIKYDGVEITLKKCEESKGEKDSFIEPEKGNVFVVGKVVIKNKSDKKISVNWASFEGYYDDTSVEPDPIGQSMTKVKKEGELFGDVAPGKKIKGCVVYQVPKKWKKMEIIPKFDYDLADEQNNKYVIVK